MDWEKFSYLWDTTVGNNITGIDARPETVEALIEYGLGKKDKLQSVKEFLKS